MKLLSGFLVLALLSPGQSFCESPQNIPVFHANDVDSPHGAHDVNSIFEYGGMGHLMNQRQGGWSHLVTKDWVSWKRIPNALTGGSGDWDGSLSVLNGKPVILFDCTDDTVCVSNRAADPKVVGDAAIIGVARPVNVSDPFLTLWEKDAHNPISVSPVGPYAGPSNLWSPRPGVTNLVMILGGKTGLYESTDPNLHNWTLVNGDFYSHRGGGGGLFFPVPGKAGLHMLQTDYPGGPGDGTALFAIGQYDAFKGSFNQTIPGPMALDFSGGMRFFELGYVFDGRMLQCGWATAAGPVSSIVREVSWDDELGILLANPVRELASHRGEQLLQNDVKVIEKNPTILLTGTVSTTLDLELVVTIPDDGSPWGMNMGALGTPPGLIALSGDGKSRAVTVQMGGGKSAAKHSFQLKPGEKSFNLRLLVDKVIVEVFVADGRAVGTTGVPQGVDATKASITLVATSNPLSIRNINAWNMGSCSK